MKISSIIQARTGSTRFPRKIYEDINGQYMLQRVLKSATSSIVPHSIILAMPEYDKKEFMERHRRDEFRDCVDGRFKVYFGHSDDLVDRYFNAARRYEVDLIVRLTADCPWCGELVDEMVLSYLKNGYNGYMGSNYLISSVPFPEGTDVEIMPYWMLAETYQMARTPAEKEHVTPYMYRRDTQYNIYEFKNCRPNKMISMRFPDFSFDTPKDLELIKKITLEYDKHGDLDKAIKETSI